MDDLLPPLDGTWPKSAPIKPKTNVKDKIPTSNTETVYAKSSLNANAKSVKNTFKSNIIIEKRNITQSIVSKKEDKTIIRVSVTKNQETIRNNTGISDENISSIETSPTGDSNFEIIRIETCVTKKTSNSNSSLSNNNSSLINSNSYLNNINSSLIKSNTSLNDINSSLINSNTFLNNNNSSLINNNTTLNNINSSVSISNSSQENHNIPPNSSKTPLDNSTNLFCGASSKFQSSNCKVSSKLRNVEQVDPERTRKRCRELDEFELPNSKKHNSSRNPCNEYSSVRSDDSTLDYTLFPSFKYDVDDFTALVPQIESDVSNEFYSLLIPYKESKKFVCAKSSGEDWNTSVEGFEYDVKHLFDNLQQSKFDGDSNSGSLCESGQ